MDSLPLDPRIISLSDKGTPFVVEDPDSKAAKAFSEVVEHLVKKIGIKKNPRENK